MDNILNNIDSKIIEYTKSKILFPGEFIEKKINFIAGDGTYVEKNNIYSSILGYINKTNKYISVVPLKNQYKGEVGDVVIGIVKEIYNKKWKIDILAGQNATLHLNSVKFNEIQRRKTKTDESNMKNIMKEGDVMVGEIQTINKNDNTIQLHISSISFGKLEIGNLIQVNSYLVKRHKNHIVNEHHGLKFILSLNGYIWIEPHDQQITSDFIKKLQIFSNIFNYLNENYLSISFKIVFNIYEEYLIKNDLEESIKCIFEEKYKKLTIDEIKNKLN